jgi:hypothetical protein
MPNLASGKTYNSSFLFPGNRDGDPTTNAVNVTVGGDPAQFFSYDPAASGTTKAYMTWASKSFSF